MAQLSDDCFAFGGALMPVDEALVLIAARLVAVDGFERVPLHDADNRVLVADLAAPVPLPLFANSAVDGYAIAGADLPQDHPRAYMASQRVDSRRSGAAACHRHGCAHLYGRPDACRHDTVFMQEDVEVDGDKSSCHLV